MSYFVERLSRVAAVQRDWGRAMYLTYVDESYDRHFYWIAALLVPETSAIPLAEALDDVVRKAVRSYANVPSGAELHGHALMNAKGDWTSLKVKGRNMIRARIGIYSDALRAVACQPTKVIVRGIDREAQARRHAPTRRS